MKKTMILAAFAALISLASCQKEEVIDNKGTDKNESPVFTASIAGATKTTVNLSDGKVAWEETDEITVTDASSASTLYEIESIDETTGKATFAIKSGETALGDGPYTATYGTVPATDQTYSATAGKLYMTAATEDNSFTFDVQCGLMKLNLTSPDESVKSIAVSNSTATYTLTCDPAQSIATAKDFCIALPAGSYTKIEITNAEDVTCTLNSTNGVEVATNHIKPVTFGTDKLNFSPATTGTAKATINGVETDVKWIQLWENGPKFAEYNVGTTSEKKYGAYFAWAENIASSQWGDNWRMPTADEYQALLDNCTFSSEERNGVNGYVVTGKKGTAYALNSVFFPAGSGDGFGGLNNCGWYWSSSSISSERAWLLSFDISQSDRLVDGDDCTCRYTVRAVLNEAPAVPDGALPGMFSVSATKKVYFSQGNLVATIDATGAPTAWKFATNQYDFLGTGGANQTIGTAAGDVDLFGWSTEATTYGISTSDDDLDYLGDFVDWGTAIDNKGTWHTPSYDEWHYLLTTTARMEYGKPCYTIAKSGITIGETTYKGLFLYPDNYNGAEVSESMTWDEINAAGVVFIPAAKSRDGKRVSTTRHGIWSSTTDPGDVVEYACKFYITDRVEGEEYDLRHYGFPVRLVSDVK